MKMVSKLEMKGPAREECVQQGRPRSGDHTAPDPELVQPVSMRGPLTWGRSGWQRQEPPGYQPTRHLNKMTPHGPCSLSCPSLSSWPEAGHQPW